MHILTIVGLGIGACVMFIDRHLRKIPSRPAVALYCIALVLMIAGIVVSKTQV